MIGDEVDDDLHRALMQIAYQRVEFGERTEQRIHVSVVRHVVSTVCLWRGVERGQPDGIDAEHRKVIEPLANPGEIANAVAIAVGKTADVDLVDHGVTPPVTMIIGHDHGSASSTSNQAEGSRT